jgi:hypothetical protein
MSGQPLDALTVLCTVSRLVTVPLDAALQHKKEAVQSALLPLVRTDTPWTSGKEVYSIHCYYFLLVWRTTVTARSLY